MDARFVVEDEFLDLSLLFNEEDEDIDEYDDGRMVHHIHQNCGFL
jgi:hypothetical protein